MASAMSLTNPIVIDDEDDDALGRQSCVDEDALERQRRADEMARTDPVMLRILYSGQPRKLRLKLREVPWDNDTTSTQQLSAECSESIGGERVEQVGERGVRGHAHDANAGRNPATPIISLRPLFQPKETPTAGMWQHVGRMQPTKKSTEVSDEKCSTGRVHTELQQERGSRPRASSLIHLGLAMCCGFVVTSSTRRASSLTSCIPANRAAATKSAPRGRAATRCKECTVPRPTARTMPSAATVSSIRISLPSSMSPDRRNSRWSPHGTCHRASSLANIFASCKSSAVSAASGARVNLHDLINSRTNNVEPRERRPQLVHGSLERVRLVHVRNHQRSRCVSEEGAHVHTDHRAAAVRSILCCVASFYLNSACAETSAWLLRVTLNFSRRP